MDDSSGVKSLNTLRAPSPPKVVGTQFGISGSAMSNDGEDSRASGWNRRFIEGQFGKETADRLRCALMNVWRKDHPTLPSERPEDQRGTLLYRWQLGLAALYAEAEDPSWATKLSEEEAALAVRYAPIELNGLPTWIENLVDESIQGAVDSILGQRVELGIEKGTEVHMVIQSYCRT